MNTSINGAPETEPTGFAIKTIFITAIWTVMLGSAIGYAIKYGLELTRVVDTARANVHEGPVRIGVFSWPGYYPLVVAKRLGLYEKYGVQVELVKGRSIGELNDWIRTGRTQASVGVLADFIVLRSLGAPVQMLTATDYSLADVILGNGLLKGPRDLNGKRIGLSELNSFAEYFVIRSLELSGVNTRSVKLYTVPFERVPDAILAGEIDAGHTWDPALSIGLQRGLKRIISSAENPRLVIDGIAFRAEISQDITIPLAITRAFFEAQALQKTDPVQFASIAAGYFEMTTEQAQKFIDEDARFADLDENINLYEPNGLLRKEAQSITQFFNERGMGGNTADLEKLIDDSVIRRIEDERAVGYVPSTQDGMATSSSDWRTSQ